MNAPATTPATESTENTASALSKFLESVKSEKVNATDKKQAASKFKAVIAKRAELEAALEALDKDSEQTIKEMVKCYKRDSVIVGGVQYAPTSRGERISYKKMSAAGIEI